MNRPIDPAQAPASALPRQRRFQSHDGTSLGVLHWPASEIRRGAVILLHRGHEHGERLARIVNEVPLRDYDVYAVDMCGHGVSGGVCGGGDQVHSLICDLDCFTRHLKAMSRANAHPG